MVLNIKKEEINHLERFDDYKTMTEEKWKAAAEEAVSRLRAHLSDFGPDRFPGPASIHEVYEATENNDWTEGFYTGMLWLSYELTGDETFRTAAESQIGSYLARIENRVNVDHHDMGFLYTPSCVSCYRLTGNETAKKAALLAADNLMSRFQEKGGFIQAWGKMGAADNYRLIIDCLLNIPLLYWASEVTGDPRYQDVATRHFHTAASVVIREDASTHHTYYFDPETGAPLRGVTHQGYSDDSAWARGQAWGIYGLALGYGHTKEENVPYLFECVTNYFVNRLPQDKVAFWDLVFTDGDDEPRDSSANAIAVCGMLSAVEQGMADETYLHLAKSLLGALVDKYTTKEAPHSNGLLRHATYAKNGGGGGVDECNIWGDYFYLEALTRLLKPDWKQYW